VEATRSGYGRSFHYIDFWRLTAGNPEDFARGISKMADFSSEVRKIG
jgi:hypothetical protein